MESANEPRLQLLSLSKDPAHIERITAMVHGHGIQTVTELTSLPWRSAGLESFVMVSTEDYPEAPLREYRRTKVLKLVARHSPDHRVRANPLPRPLVLE
jgi:hypothetical protein